MLTLNLPCKPCDGTGHQPGVPAHRDPETGLPSLPPCTACGGIGIKEVPLLEAAKKSRALAYEAYETASRTLREAQLRGGVSREKLGRLSYLSQEAWAEYRRWVEADSFAAQAGVHDYDDSLDRFQD